jgi:endonuclease/exonuclease/phosphatase family metal-dependent hydrolase
MRFYALLSLCMIYFLIACEAHALRVIWWNVGGHYEKSSVGAIEYGRLINQQKPDILILGEYFNESEPELEEQFQYKTFKANYDHKPNFGIVVLSHYPFTVDDQNHKLAWLPEHKQDIWPETYKNEASKFERPFWIVKFNHPTRLNIVPIHLLQPWVEMKKATNTARTIYNVLYGTDHPLEVQIQNLKSALQDHVDPSEPTLMIGDFNIPDRWLFIEPATFKTLKQDWNYVRPIFGRRASYENYFRLDHAFTNTSAHTSANTPCARILEYKGSDHYPLLVEF